MTAVQTLDVSPLPAARQALRGLRDGGFEVSDADAVVRVQGRLNATPLKWALPLALKSSVQRTQAYGRRREYEVTLSIVNGAWEVAALPEVNPDQLFDRDDLDAARRLWDRDASATTSLDFEWTIQVDLDLSRLLAPPLGNSLQVNWQKDYLEQQLGTASVANLRRYIPATGRRVFLALEGAATPISFGSVTLATLDGTAKEGLEIIPATNDLPGEGARADLPAPAEMLWLSGDEAEWPMTARAMAAGACTAIWTHVASAHSDNKVEFFGYKRVVFELPALWSPAEIQSSMRLRVWAFAEVSPDRLLALRQIISLYTEPPFDFVDEILASSETIYLGLRSSAVAEAVRDTRDLEMQVQRAVSQSSESSVALAKSTSERIIAGLLAVGAAAIANVTQVLDASVTTVILGFVGGYFVVMLVLFLLVDFKAVGLPLKQVETTQGLRSSFVRDDVLKSVASSPLISGAKVLVMRVRISVTSLYGVIVVALVTTVAVRLLT